MRDKIDRVFDTLLGDEEGSRDWDRDDLWEIGDEDAFEELIADLWEDMGYNTRVTASTNDDGADVIAEQPGLL
jgi:hypothetical protein